MTVNSIEVQCNWQKQNWAKTKVQNCSKKLKKNKKKTEILVNQILPKLYLF